MEDTEGGEGEGGENSGRRGMESVFCSAGNGWEGRGKVVMVIGERRGAADDDMVEVKRVYFPVIWPTVPRVPCKAMKKSWT